MARLRGRARDVSGCEGYTKRVESERACRIAPREYFIYFREALIYFALMLRNVVPGEKSALASTDSSLRIPALWIFASCECLICVSAGGFSYPTSPPLPPLPPPPPPRIFSVSLTLLGISGIPRSISGITRREVRRIQ